MPTPQDAATRVLLVDAQGLFRAGLELVLNAHEDFIVVAQAREGRQAIDAAQRLRPELILMDLELPGLPGLSVAGYLIERMPESKVVALMDAPDDDTLLEAVRLGVHGFGLKDTTPDELVDLLRRAVRGENPVAPPLVGRLLAAIRTPAPHPGDAGSELSARELEIMRLVAQGFTNREIGAQLFITEGTVKNHVHNTLRKLHLENRGQAAAWLVRSGLVEH